MKIKTEIRPISNNSDPVKQILAKEIGVEIEFKTKETNLRVNLTFEEIKELQKQLNNLNFT